MRRTTSPRGLRVHVPLSSTFRRWWLRGPGPALLAVAAVAAQDPPQDCLLTLSQEVAIAAARDKLLDCAFGRSTTVVENARWDPDDPRWGALSGLLSWYYWGRFAPEAKNKIRNDHIAPALGSTKAANGRVSRGQWETICLDKSTWKGPEQNHYGSEDPTVACWMLAGVLLHEFSHSYDDDYEWPTVTPGDMKAHACGEEEGYCFELEVLLKGARPFGENPPQDLLDRIAIVCSQKSAAARAKEAGQ